MDTGPRCLHETRHHDENRMGNCPMGKPLLCMSANLFLQGTCPICLASMPRGFYLPRTSTASTPPRSFLPTSHDIGAHFYMSSIKLILYVHC